MGPILAEISKLLLTVAVFLLLLLFLGGGVEGEKEWVGGVDCWERQCSSLKREKRNKYMWLGGGGGGGGGGGLLEVQFIEGAANRFLQSGSTRQCCRQ